MPVVRGANCARRVRGGAAAAAVRRVRGAGGRAARAGCAGARRRARRRRALRRRPAPAAVSRALAPRGFTREGTQRIRLKGHLK